MRYDLLNAGLVSAPVRVFFAREDLSGAGSAQEGGNARRAGPPNILLVCLDQKGLANSAAFGGPCSMPILEQLVVAGRVALSKGAAAAKAPSHVSAGNRPVTEVLKAQGYATARFGLCPDRDGCVGIGRSFDHVDAMVGETLQFSPRNEPLPCHFTEFMTSRAIDWLEHKADQKPFFMTWSPRLPASAEEVPGNWTAKHRANYDGLDVAALSGFLDYVDYQLGRLIDHLERKALVDDTLILVTGLADTRAPVPLFMDILLEDRISPEDAAMLVDAQIRLRGGAEAYLEKASERGSKAMHVPHWAHNAGLNMVMAGTPVVIHWPSEGDHEGIVGSDVSQLILAAAGQAKAAPLEPNLWVVYSFPVTSG